MKIFAVIVTYNGTRWYDRCLGSLRNSEVPIETIVIDNASTDGTIEYIKKHFSSTIIIESNDNLGFAKANNIGIRYALDHDADYVFLLNQDAWIEKDTLTKLVQTFKDNENVGIVSPIHLKGDYSGLDIGFTKYMSTDFVSDAYMGNFKNSYYVNSVNAAAWLIKTETIRKVGGFDTLLFVHYGEDDNYCQRIKYHGFKIAVCTNATICHDRECRKGNDDNDPGRLIFNVKSEVLRMKKIYGDINMEVDLDKLIKKERLYMFGASLCLKFSSVKYRSQNIGLLKQIKVSRILNKQGGEIWID
ncbi:MAG: glycosyltransferase family 2 protein [Bacteroidales bacterium]|nr:glycosyltransferase family 2 protein [Bacteroidales bacterium]